MRAHFSHVAIRWALIGGIALSAPWFVSRSKFSARDADAWPVVFRIGEVLNYRIDWGRYTGAAAARLQIIDRSTFEGAAAWHFRATVHTAEPVRALYPMDDQLDSYAMPGNFTSREYQEHFREFGELQNTEASLVSPGVGGISLGPRVMVPAGTRDALSAIYFLRMTDWTGGREIRVPVFDGQNVYQMLAKASAPSAIEVAAGTYQSTEIEIHLFDEENEIPNENFNLWLADDRGRTPVLCEAYLSIGKIRVELVSDSSSEADARRREGGATRPAGSSHRAGN